MLSDSHLSLYDERQQIMKLRRDYDQLRSKSLALVYKFLQLRRERIRERLESFRTLTRTLRIVVSKLTIKIADLVPAGILVF